MTIWAYGKYEPKIDPSAWIFPSADVIGNIIIGKDVYIGPGAVIRGDYGKIVIGDGSAIEENVTIHARMGDTCTIEENVTIGHAAMIHTCTLRKGCVIGMNCTVTDWAEVGENAIIGEGAVVATKSKIASNMVAVGIPAKEIKPVSEQALMFWKAAKEIYQGLCKDYPKKLRKISD
jgi:carbonic anhydrase/acetyltransferase-like protein (isoleucine patch superfamily)